VQELKSIHLNRNTVAEGVNHIANDMRDRSGKCNKNFQSESIKQDEEFRQLSLQISLAVVTQMLVYVKNVWNSYAWKDW
jgi:hypothetical protein